MTILPYIDILEVCYNPKNITKHKLAFDAVYNSGNTICVSKQYLTYVENSITDKNAFMALITELFDSNRIDISKNNSKPSLTEEFIEIIDNHKNPMLIPVAFNSRDSDFTTLKSIAIVNKPKRLDKNNVLLQLISQGIANVCHSDFKSDIQIESFFSDVFDIPKYIRLAYVFDRDQVGKFLKGLKGCHILYYTVMGISGKGAYDRKRAKQELRTELGGKLKLYSTQKSNLLHERKIIFEGMIVTIDNSRNNLNIKEPTWEIFVLHDESKCKAWTEKCREFVEVPD